MGVVEIRVLHVDALIAAGIASAEVFSRCIIGKIYAIAIFGASGVVALHGHVPVFGIGIVAELGETSEMEGECVLLFCGELA